MYYSKAIYLFYFGFTCVCVCVCVCVCKPEVSVTHGAQKSELEPLELDILTINFANSYSFVLYKKYIATFGIPSLLIMD